jgi:hypothetical protein
MSRLIFALLFIIGIIGILVGSERAGSAVETDSTLVSLIKEVRLAQEIDAINQGREENALDEKALNKVEWVFAQNSASIN